VLALSAVALYFARDLAFDDSINALQQRGRAGAAGDRRKFDARCRTMVISRGRADQAVRARRRSRAPESFLADGTIGSIRCSPTCSARASAAGHRRRREDTTGSFDPARGPFWRPRRERLPARSVRDVSWPDRPVAEAHRPVSPATGRTRAMAARPLLAGREGSPIVVPSEGPAGSADPARTRRGAHRRRH
jgi:hypothetical protein